MKLVDLLQDLADELDRVHGGALPWLEEDGLPTFVTASNGATIYFSRIANERLLQISKALHAERSTHAPRIDLEEYIAVVRQAVADLHAAGDLSDRDAAGLQRSVRRLRALVDESIKDTASERTHYFPAWTLGIEKDAPFTLGSVTLLSREDWLQSVDFPEGLKERCFGQPEANWFWKVCVKKSFENQERPSDGNALARVVYNATAACPSLIKVPVYGRELHFSRKLGRIVAKTALDAISLSVGPPECFLQQALQEERLPPFGTVSFPAGGTSRK